MSMIRALAAISLSAALLFSSAAGAACTYPDQVTKLPNGKTASKEEMITAQKAVKAYVQEMEQYMACLQADIEALGEDASEEQLLMRDKRHNAAIDAMDKVAGEFNLAVREFKARE